MTISFNQNHSASFKQALIVLLVSILLPPWKNCDFLDFKVDCFFGTHKCFCLLLVTNMQFSGFIEYYRPIVQGVSVDRKRGCCLDLSKDRPRELMFQEHCVYMNTDMQIPKSLLKVRH